MKRYRVVITDPAEQDIRDNHAWWSENRSAAQAANWLFGIRNAILALGSEAERYAFADETSLCERGVRQMGYYVGPVATHRVLYQIIDDEAIVYRVRSVRQDAVRLSDLIDND